MKWAASAALALFVVVVVNTLRRGKEARAEVAKLPGDAVDASRVAEHLAQAIRWKTVSHDDPKDDDYGALDGFQTFLETTYPKVHATLHRTIINEHALVYTWQGSDPSLRPVLFAAHQDVVPVEPGTESGWTHAPFDGVIADGHVWGRGARDDKGSLIVILKAAEALVTHGFTPKRTMVLAFGFDEEVGGKRGARLVADAFASKGTRFDYVLDEGGLVTRGVVPGLASPLAVIDLTEKGLLTVELSAAMPTGHSSMPPPQTSIGIVAAAIDRLEHHQMPTRMPPTTRRMLETIAPDLPFGRRVLMSNLWLFEPLVLSTLTKQQTGNATVRTTTAATLFEGGMKENVLPSVARALVNFRILPGDTVETVLAHVKNVIADATAWKVVRREQLLGDPPPASPTDSRAYRLIETTVRQFFPEALVVPSVLVGASDARHYTSIADGVYHFSPFVLDKEDLSTIHGTE